MKKIILLTCILIITKTFSQNLIFDNFSTFNLAKIDGQNGWSTATPSLGNGTGSCGPICEKVSIVTKSLSYPGFATTTKALNPIDGALNTEDGPGKSVGNVINNGSIYVALLVNFNSPLQTATDPKQVIRFMDNGFATAARIYIKLASGGGAFNVGVDKNLSAIAYSSSTYSYNQDHLIILKYKFNPNSGDDVAAVYVDPDMALPEPNSPTVSAGGTDASTITRVACPWNSNFLPNGYIGAVSVARDWASIVPPSGFNITGQVINPLKKSVPKVKFKITSQQGNDSVITTTNGSFAFNNIPTNDYTIKASKLSETTKANGINTADVLFIQRHVLGTTKLNSAYKMIAADVDGNRLINTADILRIKRLILGTDSVFVSNARGSRMWEFVDSAYVFPDTANPFPFKDSIKVVGLNSNIINTSFIGIKLGDVDFNWNPAILKTNKQKLNLQSRVEALANNVYAVNVTSTNFKNMATLQFTAHFDIKNFELVDVKNNALNFEFNKLNTNKTGDIACLWINDETKPKSVNNQTLFTIYLKPKSLNNIRPALNLSNKLVGIEALNDALESVEVLLK